MESETFIPFEEPFQVLIWNFFHANELDLVISNPSVIQILSIINPINSWIIKWRNIPQQIGTYIIFKTNNESYYYHTLSRILAKTTQNYYNPFSQNNPYQLKKSITSILPTIKHPSPPSTKQELQLIAKFKQLPTLIKISERPPPPPPKTIIAREEFNFLLKETDLLDIPLYEDEEVGDDDELIFF